MNEKISANQIKEIKSEIQIEEFGLFSTLIDHLPHKVFLKDSKSKYISCNKAYAADLGISPDEIVGRTDVEFYPPDLAGKYQADDLRIVETGQAEEIEETYQVNGEVYTVQTTKSPIRSSSGEVIGVLGIFHDISEKKRILDELSATDLRFRSLLAYTTDAIFCYEYDPPIDITLPVEKQIPMFYRGILVECNQKAAATYQADKPEDVIGKSIQELFQTEANGLDDFYRMFIENDYQVVGLEAEEVHEDGTKHRYQNNGYGVIEGGKLKRVWGTYQDITERTQKDRLIRIQRDLGLALLTTRSLVETLELCLESAIQISSLDSGGIYLFNEDGGMELVTTTGLPEEFVKVSKVYGPETPNVQLVLKGEPIYTRHQDLGIDVDGPRKKEGLRGIGILPIAYEGEIIACLNIASHIVDEVPQHARESLRIIANQIGIAIARSKTEVELAKHRENLEEIVAERTKELYDSEARLRAFVSAVPDLIFIIDENGLYVDVFTADERLLYRELADIKGHTLSEIFPEDVANEFHDLITKTLESGKSQKIEYSMEVQDGLKWFESQTAPISNQDVANDTSLVVWIARDITDRKLAEKKIRESETRFRAIYENSPLGILTVDTSSSIIDANHSFCKMLGYEAAELIGKSFQEFTYPDDLSQAAELIKTVVIDRVPSVSHEMRLVNKKGEIVWSNFSSSMLFDDEGKPMLGLSVVEDISDRVEAQKTLERTSQKLASSNEELEQFAYIASHDLQEPLRKISAFSTRLQEKYTGELDGKAQDYLYRMHNASERGQQLINDLLEFSRVTTQGKPFDTVDLNQTLKDVITTLEFKLEESAGKISSETLPIVSADNTQMFQLFQNLVSNSLKFSSPGKNPEIKIQSNIVNDVAEIQVIDNGIGFDMEYHDRIFQPFQRLHGQSEYDGSGIGLSICRKIMERHHGSLEAVSEPDQGATFIIRIPVSENGTENDKAGKQS